MRSDIAWKRAPLRAYILVSPIRKKVLINLLLNELVSRCSTKPFVSMDQHVFAGASNIAETIF